MYKKGDNMIKKIMKKTTAIIMAAACVITMSGCGGKGNDSKSSELAEGVYRFEEKTLVTEKDAITSSFYLKGNELYYQYYAYAEFPEEYYEDLNKIQDDSDDIARTETVIEDGSTESLASDENSSDSESDSKDKETSSNDGISDDNISDDDLLGNIDDMFGDDADKDDASADNSGDEQKGKDDKDSDVMTWEELEEKYKDYQPDSKMCKYNIETEENTELFDLDTEKSFNSYYVNDDNQIVAVVTEYNEEKQKQGINNPDYYIAKYDMEGKELSKNKFSDKIEGSQSEEFYFGSILFDSEGAVYTDVNIGEKTTLYKISAEGEVAGKVEVDGYLDSVILDNEGKVVISKYGEDGTKFYYADMEKGVVGDEIQGMASENGMGRALSGSGDIPFFVKDSVSLYRYDSEAAEKKPILKWMDCGLVGDSVSDIIPLDDGRMFCIYENTEGTKVGFLVKSDEDSSDKKVIKFGSIYMNSDIQEKIIAYNKTNPEYKIEYVSYENEGEPEKAFANDIISGNIPDIIDVSSVDVENYVAKGILEDLTPYIEKDDTINKDYFIDGILDATKVDGKNYYVSKALQINTLAVKASDTEKFGDGWTASELIDYYNSKPEGTQLTDYDYRDGIFYSFVNSDLSNYVDWKTGKVSFDNGEFKKILEFCNKFPSDYTEEGEIDSHKLIKQGKVLTNSAYIGDVSSFQATNKLFEEDIKYIGYPNSEKKGNYISLAGATLGLSASSELKDEAWAFLKQFMTEKDSFSYGIPVSRSEFDAMVKKETTTEKYTDENGEVVMPKNDSYGFNNFEVKLGPATDKEIDALKALIKKGKVVYYDYGVMEMISEEVNNYFEGKKSVDDTIKILQDKIGKYVNENK